VRIAVIGAGVSGLTTAVVLAEAGHDVSVLAKETDAPTSLAAAAVWYPYHVGGAQLDAWAAVTRDVLNDLCAISGSGVSTIAFQIDEEPVVRVPLMDTTRYLEYLRSRLGRRIDRREIASFDEIDDADVVVNCTGFGARALCADEELLPGHGVSIVTRRPALARALVRSEPLTYIIPRTTDCILGGYDAEAPPRHEDIVAIVARCRQLVPDLTDEILAVKHGIRPIRGEVRLEREGRVIHNYGHGGAGFTLSWGCAFAVRDLL
jgi:D-amino-acid oxidase